MRAALRRFGFHRSWGARCKKQATKNLPVATSIGARERAQLRSRRWRHAGGERMHECTVYNHPRSRPAVEVILRALRVARHLLSPWMSQAAKGVSDAVDNLRDPADPLAPGNGERVDLRRVHPPPADRRDRGGAHPRHPGTTTHLTAMRTLASLVLLGCAAVADRKSTRLNSSHANISYAVFCLKKKKT